MTQITGTESIAFANIILQNKKLITIKNDLFEKNKQFFENALKTRIKEVEIKNIQKLLNFLQQDNTIKSKMTGMYEKGEFINVNDLIPVFQKNLETEITAEIIADIFTNLRLSIANDLNLNTQLKNIYQQIIIKHGKWDLALAFFNEELNRYEDDEDNYSIAKTFNGLADIYQAKGEWNRSIGHYEQALAKYEHCGDTSGIAQCWGSIGNVYQAKNDLDKAIEFYDKSLEAFENNEDNYGQALTYNNLGLVYQEKGEQEIANDLFNKSWNIFEEEGNMQGMAQTKGNLSMLAFANKDYKTAIKNFFEILLFYTKMEAMQQVNQALAILKYFTNQLESEIVNTLFKSVQDELSNEGVTWGKHAVLSNEEVKQLYSNLTR